MNDFERYGDYNEIDEPPSKNRLSLTLAIAAGAVILLVVLVVCIRLFTFNHYPKAMKTLYFNDTLTEYYNANDGNIEVLTQELRAPYDDADHSNFFVGKLMVIPEINQLQMCVRFNKSLGQALFENYGLENFDPDNELQFSFRLWRDGDDTSPDGYEVGRLTVTEWDSFAMYKYCKLVFDDVPLGLDSEEHIEWLRLDIFIEGIDSDTPFMVAVYENNDEYSKFDEYKLSRKEKP